MATPRKPKTTPEPEAPEAVEPEAATPAEQPPVDGVEPLEGTPDPEPEAKDDTDPVAPAGIGPAPRADQRDPTIAAKPADATVDTVVERRRGSGPQTVDGYTPPTPTLEERRGKAPAGFTDEAFTLRTGPTSPTVVDQTALAAVAAHFPDELGSDRPAFHDAD